MKLIKLDTVAKKLLQILPDTSEGKSKLYRTFSMKM